MILNQFCSTFSLCGISFAKVSIILFWAFFLVEYYWRLAIISFDIESILFNLLFEVSITLFWAFFSVENYWRLAIITFDPKSILFNLFTVWYQLCKSINRSFLGIFFGGVLLKTCNNFVWYWIIFVQPFIWSINHSLFGHMTLITRFARKPFVTTRGKCQSHLHLYSKMTIKSQLELLIIICKPKIHLVNTQCKT